MGERDDELDDLREQRLEELKENQGEGDGEGREEARQQAEAQKQAILKQYLTDGARQRLNTVKMTKPGFAEQVEQQLVSLAGSGRLGDRIDEDQMKELLGEMSPDSKSFDIKRR
jgi:programmed cell death protein 5